MCALRAQLSRMPKPLSRVNLLLTLIMFMLSDSVDDGVAALSLNAVDDNGRCLRPDCDVPDEFCSIDRIVGRTPSDVDGPSGEPIYLWLVKWDGYVGFSLNQSCCNIFTCFHARYAWDRCSWIPRQHMDNSETLIEEFRAVVMTEKKSDWQSGDTILLEEAIMNGWTGIEFEVPSQL